MFRLAQVSDPHFQSLRNLKLRDFLGKRLLGGVNLLVRRRRKHRMELLQAMGEDLRRREFDHLAVTGDLSNIALTSEWEAALRWTAELNLSPDRVTIIPGNHDAYVPAVVRDGTFETMFADYQTAELRVGRNAYPFVRLRDEVALICVSTAVPTGDAGAWGRMGSEQLLRLESLLTSAEVKRRCRVVLVHHPLLVNRSGEDRNLRDRTALQALLSRTGADLVLHGHDHRDFFKSLPGPGGTAIPVIGVGSASYDGAADRRSRYHIFEIDGKNITAITYVHEPASGKFVEYARRSLEPGRDGGHEGVASVSLLDR
jgi:3',5'-cyclic AMP phosphodiesterase CpdA